MPAALRPLSFVILFAVMMVSFPGCIFPFTRGNDAKLQRVIQGEPQAAAETPKPQTEPPAKKKLPPFAQFLGDMFRDDEAAEAPSNSAASESVVTEVAAPPEVTPAPVVSAEEYLASQQPQPRPQVTAPSPPSQQPLPVVVSSAEVASSSGVQVPSPGKETPAPQQVAEAAPSRVSSEPDPAIPSEELDEYTQSPWTANQSLLQQAKQNSAGQSTLARSLDLALESFRAENREQPATSAQVAPPQESAAQEKVATAPPAAPAEETTPDARNENPLRLARGSTDWSGRSLREGTAPQTIVNSTTETYPKTESKPLKWAPQEAEAATITAAETTKPAAAAPQITVNPYADVPAAKEVAEPAKASGPQMVTNPMVTPAEPEAKPVISTDAIHFQSSLLAKLQAANHLAAWDLTQGTAAAYDKNDVTPVTQTKNDLPKIVDSSAQDAELAVRPEPRMTLNPMAAPSPPAPTAAAEVAAPPIQPFIIAPPEAQTASQRGTSIRLAQPAPLVVENVQGTESDQPSSHLAPVVRASEAPGPPATSSSRGTKIYMLENTSP